MTERLWGVLFIVLLVSCSRGSGPQGVVDPISNIPGNRQRTVSRSEFDRRWPFTVGTGTLGCSSGAVVFRANGVTYALNDTARAQGFSSVDPIWVTQHSGPPRNPLKGMNQDQRMQVFARVAACRKTAAREQTVDATRCKQRIRDAHRLTDDQLEQIEAEGEERRWPPLPAQRIDLRPLIDAGVPLCQG